MKRSEGLFYLVMLLSSLIVNTIPLSSASPSAQFSPIQEIINNAENGTTVYISPGIYYGLFKVNKTLTLIGTNVIVDANGSQVGIIISASNVTIEGFTVKNTFRYGNGSIPPEISELCTYPEMEGAGIYVYSAKYVTIVNATVKECYAGIGFGRSPQNQILNSQVYNTTWGIMLVESDNIKIFKSLITLNGDPVNNLHNSGGGGIWLGKYSRYVSIKNSTISFNVWGIVVLPTSVSNKIFFNNFVDNTHQVHVHPDTGRVGWWWYNYWSDYNGTDSDLDGIGDTPYIIDDLNYDPYPLMVALEADVSSLNLKAGGVGSNFPMYSRR